MAVHLMADMPITVTGLTVSSVIRWGPRVKVRIVKPQTMFQPSCGNIFLFQQGAEKKDDTERRLRGELCLGFICCPAEMYIFSVHFHTFKWALILPETMKNSFGCFYHGYRTQRLSAGRLVVPCLNHINPYDKNCSVKRFFFASQLYQTGWKYTIT